MEVNELAVKEILDELNDVKLIAATKYVGIDEINKLENLGVMYFGENRVQAFLEKYQKYNNQENYLQELRCFVHYYLRKLNNWIYYKGR